MSPISLYRRPPEIVGIGRLNIYQTISYAKLEPHDARVVLFVPSCDDDRIINVDIGEIPVLRSGKLKGLGIRKHGITGQGRKPGESQAKAEEIPSLHVSHFTAATGTVQDLSLRVVSGEAFNFFRLVVSSPADALGRHPRV
jgi:hypothetical protein